MYCNGHQQPEQLNNWMCQSLSLSIRSVAAIDYHFIFKNKIIIKFQTHKLFTQDYVQKKSWRKIFFLFLSRMLSQYQYCVSFVEIYKYKTFINLNTQNVCLLKLCLFINIPQRRCLRKYIFLKVEVFDYFKDSR